MASKIGIIITSARTPRIGPHVAKLVKDIISQQEETASIEISLVDLADYKLPVYDEPVVPFQVPDQASFKFDHSRRWSAEIAKHDAYILLSLSIIMA
jgi:NAD(P)H-dependent FMN reductase